VVITIRDHLAYAAGATLIPGLVGVLGVIAELYPVFCGGSAGNRDRGLEPRLHY
jgi:hypothetical protein